MGYAYDQQNMALIGDIRSLGTKRHANHQHYKSYKGYIIIGEVHGRDR
jgi:hypothetical protein